MPIWDVLPSLDGIRLKMQRAYNQIEFLKGEISSFIDTRPYVPTLQLNRIGRNPCIDDFTIRMSVRRPCPPDWGVIIGEIVHDVRSALDHTIYQLVIHATGDPPADDTRTQFPIFIKPTGFDSCRGTMLRGVGQRQATTLIKDLQPFSTGEDSLSPLWHLNKLSNIDKHRTLHLTGGTIQSFQFDFPPVINPGRVERHQFREGGAFDNNTIMGSGHFISDNDKPMFGDQMQMEASISVDVVFDQRTPLIEGWSVNGTLLNIADRSRDCIARIGSEILSLDFVL